MIVLTVPIILLVNKVFKTSKNFIWSIIIDILLECIYFGIVKHTNLDESYWLYIVPPVRKFEYVESVLVVKLVNNIVIILHKMN